VWNPKQLRPISASALIFHKELMPFRKRRFRFFWKQTVLAYALLSSLLTVGVYLYVKFQSSIPGNALGYLIFLGIVFTAYGYRVRYLRKISSWLIPWQRRLSVQRIS
jgi:H+/Cl- antiporter ClcA